MKKYIALTGLIFLIAVCNFCLFGCANELDVITLEEFQQKMSEYGLSVFEGDTDFSSVNGVGSAFIAVSEEGWQIEYYVCDDNESALELYSYCKEYMKSCKGNVSSSKNYGSGNRMSFEINSDTCGYLRIMDNCVLYTLEPKMDYLLKVCPALNQLGIIA